MAYQTPRLGREAQRAIEESLTHLGDPGRSFGKLPDLAQHTGRLKIRVLRPFTYLGGVLAEPGQKLTIEADMARGLQKTGHCEISET